MLVFRLQASGLGRSGSLAQVSFTGAINACARVSNWQESLCLLWSMKDESVPLASDWQGTRH